MKRSAALLVSLLIILPLKAQKDEIIKTGWNFGPLPVVGFDSDLGFQYGICCDIFNFGDGSGYPNYNYKINIEASTYTKGSGILRTYGDFKTLIPEGILFVDVTYFNAPKFGFYGYNGLSQYKDQPFLTGTVIPDDYNLVSRKQFRALASVRKTISGNLSAAAGLAYYHVAADKYSLSDDNVNKLSLYDLYLLNGLINDDEKDGGNVTQLRAGIVYDSRDLDSDPTHGINMEASLVYTPDLIDRKGYSNLGFHLSYSQFLSPSERLTFAYRALVQTKLWGDIPYYFTNNINSMFFRKIYTEGIGGNASVRGLYRNGVLGDGFAMLNLELRWRILDFKLINQNWQIAANPFFDAGTVLQPYRLDKQKNSGFYGDEKELHCTAGLGFKLVMNHNLVVSFEAGKAFKKVDGDGLWTNIGFNYLF